MKAKYICVFLKILFIYGLSFPQNVENSTDSILNSIIDSFALYRNIEFSQSKHWADLLLQKSKTENRYWKGRARRIAAIAAMDMGEFDKAKQLLQEARTYQSPNYPNEFLYLVQNLGALYQMQGANDSAMVLYTSALAEVEQSNPDYQYKTDLLESKAQIYDNLGSFSKGIELHKMALKEYRSIGDTSSIIGSYINIGFNYSKSHHLDSAIHYFNQSIELAKRVGKKRLYIKSILNKASVLRVSDNPSSALSEIDQISDDFIWEDKELLLSRIGIEIKSLVNLKQYDQAKSKIEHFESNYLEDLNDLDVIDWNNLALYFYIAVGELNNIAKYTADNLKMIAVTPIKEHLYTANFVQTLYMIVDDLQIEDKIKLRSIIREYLSNFELPLQKLLKEVETEEDYDLIFKLNQLLFWFLEDNQSLGEKYLIGSINALSMKNKQAEEVMQRNVDMVEMLGTLETQEMERLFELKQSQAKTNRNRWIAICFLIIIVMGLLYLLTLFKSNKYKTERNENLKRILEERTQNIENIKSKNSKILEQLEEKNKVLLEMNLLRSKIEAVISNIDFLASKEEYGIKLRESEEYLELKSGVKSLSIGEKQIDPLLLHFREIDQDFFSRVNELHPGLTDLELKHLAYIKLMLSAKDVAGLINVSVRTVETARYRLKKKLNLSQKSSLLHYVKEL